MFTVLFWCWQAARRLPSYEEAMNRSSSRQDMPDLLEGEASAGRGTQRQWHDDEMAHSRSRQSSEGEGPAGTACYDSVERHKAVWSSHSSSPQSSQEHSLERSGQSHRSSCSSYSSSKVESPHDQTQCPPSPNTREGVWEKLYEQGSKSYHNHQHNRPITRSYTVSTSQPVIHESSESPTTPISTSRTAFNIAECIDPTYQRRQQEEPAPLLESMEEETKAKVVPLIQPHRRRSSSDKKKKDKEKEKENCKQQ